MPALLEVVFPAHAGMSLAQKVEVKDMQGVPRTRGDEPTITTRTGTYYGCSPHTRG
ncbi:Uncharacterised protein [Corynebacterium renale]|nr:Uncharacterised protein [Corynebacterium renale]